MNKRQILLDVLSNLIIFILFFNVFAVVYVIVYNAVPWLFLLLALPFFSMLILRKAVKNTKAFNALHLIYLLLPAFIFENTATIVLVTCFAAVSVLYSITSRLKKEEHAPRVSRTYMASIMIFTIVLGVFATQVLALGGATGVVALTSISALAVILIAILFSQMSNRDFDLRVFELTDGKKAEKKVLFANNAAIAVFVAMLAVIAAVVAFVPFGRIIVSIIGFAGFLVSIVWTFLTEILSRIMPTSHHVPYQEVYEYVSVTIDEADYYYVEHEIAPSFLNWLQDLLNIQAGFLGLLAMLAIIIGILIAIIMIIRAVLRNDKGLKKADEIIGQNENISEISKLRFSLSDLAAFLPKFKIGSNHPVRKAYIKKINSHIGQRGIVIMPHHTPEMIAKLIRPRENIDELTEIYEAVRYGRVGLNNIKPAERRKNG